MADSGCQFFFFFFFWASLICDKTALKALIAFFHSCEGDHMIDVPRREIICLDSQIEKINHLRPTFNFIMGRFQRVLSGGIPAESPPSPSPEVYLSQQPSQPRSPQSAPGIRNLSSRKLSLIPVALTPQGAECV